MSKSPEVSGKTAVPQVGIKQIFGQNASVPSQNSAVINMPKQEVPNSANVVNTIR
jgi:hypothetical protein